MKPANDTAPETASELLSQHYSTPPIDGRLPLRATVLRPFGLSRQEASHRFAPLPHIAGASADLRCLNDNPAPPRPAPWWIRHSDLLACVACLCICAVTFYAIGGL